MKKCAGFTLIEVMIAISILGILSATALSAYQDYKKKKDGYQTPTAIETAIALAGQDCDIGIDNHVFPSEIAAFLNKHGVEFTAVPVGQGILVHRKSCDK